MSEALNMLREELSENVQTEFVVDNDMKAEWVLRKIREAQGDCQKFVDEYKRQMEFYKQQIDILEKQTAETVAGWEARLMPYFESRKDAGFTKATKTQTTYKLPTGTLKLKKQDVEWEHNDELLLPWLRKNHPELVKQGKEYSDWSGLKKLLTTNGTQVAEESTGEVVPGVSFATRPDKFIVEV